MTESRYSGMIDGMLGTPGLPEPQSPRERIEKIFQDAAEMFDITLGFEMSPQLSILDQTDYRQRVEDDRARLDKLRPAYVDHTDGIIFLDYDSASSLDTSKLAGIFGSYGLLHYAYVNSNEENRTNFAKLESLFGISASAQYHVKKALSQWKKYRFDMAEEARKVDAFVEVYKHTDGWPAKVGRDVTEEKVKESGQTKMIKVLTLLSIQSDNPGLDLHTISGMPYTRIIREAFEKGLINCEIENSKNAKIMERIKDFYFYVEDDRQLRNGLPILEEIADLADNDLVEEKTALFALSQNMELQASSMLIKDFPEYEMVIHKNLRTITARHNRPSLVNESATNESDKMKFAIIK